MFVSDYRPMKRLDMDGLNGLVTMLRDRTDEAYANGEAVAPTYEGAYLMLRVLRDFNFEYPRDAMASITRMIEGIE